MHDSTSDNRTVLLGGNHWSRRDLDDLSCYTVDNLLRVMSHTLTKKPTGRGKDVLWKMMLECDSTSGEELVRRKIEAGAAPRRTGRRAKLRQPSGIGLNYKLHKHAMPLPADRETYFVPVLHDQGYWAPIPDMAGRPWDNDLIIELQTINNPCQPGTDTWVLFNLLITHKYHGKTIRDWKVMDDPDRRNTIGQYRRMAMHQMRYFVRNGWVWLRRPEHKED